MAVVRILDYPDPRLSKPARLVVDPSLPEVRQMIADIRETLAATPHCGGLAASQMDFEDPFAITLMYTSTDRDAHETVCLINPVIIEEADETTEAEGCMSIYPQELFVKVSRPSYIRVRAMNEQGDFFEMEGRGYIAKCIHHELDHLKGILNIERLSKLKRSLFDRKVAKLLKNIQRN